MGVYDEEEYTECFLENEKLKKQVEKLREALKPFAAYVDQPTKIYENNGVRMALVDQDILMRLCKAAADAIKESGDE